MTNNGLFISFTDRVEAPGFIRLGRAFPEGLSTKKHHRSVRSVYRAGDQCVMLVQITHQGERYTDHSRAVLDKARRKSAGAGTRGGTGMPLAFESDSHGNVAFGFFNIHTDMLLLDTLFFFADIFCETMSLIAENPDEDLFSMEGFSIGDRSRIGDLMGAIHGYRLGGFIGEVYRKYPFPELPEDFKQMPEGHGNRSGIEDIMKRYSRPESVAITLYGKEEVRIGDYVFTKKWFHELLRYVWLGGYPRWKDGIRPGYVSSMAETTTASKRGIFTGLVMQED